MTQTPGDSLASLRKVLPPGGTIYTLEVVNSPAAALEVARRARRVGRPVTGTRGSYDCEALNAARAPQAPTATRSTTFCPGGEFEDRAGLPGCCTRRPIGKTRMLAERASRGRLRSHLLRLGRRAASADDPRRHHPPRERAGWETPATRHIKNPAGAGLFLSRSISRRLLIGECSRERGLPESEAPMFNALSDYIIFCRVERRLSELTCKTYERDVRACVEFLRSQGISALVEIRTSDLRRFLAEEATHRPAPSSQARTVAALRCFFRFCVESNYLERDPAHVLRTPKKREALPDVLDRAGCTRLLDVPSREGVDPRSRRQGRARPPTARSVRGTAAASLGAARPGLRRHRPRPPPHPCPQYV